MPVGPATVALADSETAPTPTAQIDLLPLGYGGLSAGARQSGGANLSVDFLDSNHVLVTFNPKKLFKRLPDCPSSHADRLVHAVVVAVPGGAVVKRRDWYLHDSRRYLWRLGDGRVLLRRLNKLYEVDSNLDEQLIFDSPQELLWVTVTPDGRQIIVETGSPASPAQANNKAGDAKNDAKNNDAKNKERVKISFLDARTLDRAANGGRARDDQAGGHQYGLCRRSQAGEQLAGGVRQHGHHAGESAARSKPSLYQ